MRALGKVDVLFAPNLFHHMGLKRALRVWPTAELWGPSGFLEKRSDLSFKGWIDFRDPSKVGQTGAVAWPYSKHIEIYPILGAERFQECVLYVPTEKTLIVTDLVFNLLEVSGVRARLVFGAFGTYRRLAVSRLLRSMVSDPKRFRESLECITRLQADTLIMAHGTPVQGDISPRLKAIFDL